MPTDTSTKKYTPTTGKADKHASNIPIQNEDIVLGGRQIPNPDNVQPMWDTEVAPTRLPKGVKFYKDNPVMTDVIPSPVRDN